ncbi:ATP-binding protein [Adlercreutzia sp. ZJ141]|uniref:ATP-binding protein n=1 Tax=Adlercreutzia sp. ZJ141 TaxID=2709406 RepID=UPI0013EC741E|nr:ATP-binding protein [Adlercreutzia sp. ZJ141]
MRSILNPFTPAFGGKPQHFFGRTEELALIENAFENEFSPYRALFITGNRGCGKTSILEQVSEKACAHGWLAVDVHAEEALMSAVKKLTGGTDRTISKNLQPQFAGLSVGSAATVTSKHYTGMDLADVMIEKLKGVNACQGIFVSVDEVQKISEPDAEGLCAALQMAMRKGYPVMLVMAGLPGSKEKIGSYAGCTFMQRTFEIKLSSLLIPETYEAFERLLATMPTVAVGEGAVDRLARFSLGYPYLMQLIGYYAVEQMCQSGFVGAFCLNEGDVAAAESEAYTAYRNNVLKAVTEPLRNGARAYLTSVAKVLDNTGRARTEKVAAALNKELSQCSTDRQRLIDRRLLVPDGWGYVRFNLPYLSRYLLEEALENGTAPANPDAWLF